MSKHVQIKNFKSAFKTRDVFAFCFNIAMAVLEFTALILLFTVPIEFIRGGKIVWEVSTWTTFKWFTTDSNLVMMIGSIIFCIFMGLKWNGRIKEIPESVQLMKLLMNAMLIIVLLVILGYSAVYPSLKIEMTRKGVYMGSNLLHHVICPVLAIVMALLFEDYKQINIKKTCFIFIPIVAYAIFYMALAYTHQNPDGTFQEGYDWYAFCRFGPVATAFAAIGLLGISYLFTWLPWFLNKKINIKAFR